MPRPGVLTFELPEEFSDEALEHLEENYPHLFVQNMKPHFCFKILLESIESPVFFLDGQVRPSVVT